MNPGSDTEVRANEQVQSVAELEAQLEAQQDAAQTLSRDQAVNKLVQESLKRGIDEIKKNVQEFKKDGETLGKEMRELKSKVEQKLHCVWEELGELGRDVEGARDYVDKEISKSEGDVSRDEKKLTGDLEWDSNQAARAAAMSRIAYDQLAMKSLKQRLADAQILWKEANGVPGVGHESAAEIYTLLWLANERLSKTTVVSDVGSATSDFTFPPDWTSYEKQLVDAYKAAQIAATSAFGAAKALDDANADLAEKLKSLGSQRADRKADAIRAAREAVCPPPKKERQKMPTKT